MDIDDGRCDYCIVRLVEKSWLIAWFSESFEPIFWGILAFYVIILPHYGLFYPITALLAKKEWTKV